MKKGMVIEPQAGSAPSIEYMNTFLSTGTTGIPNNAINYTEISGNNPNHVATDPTNRANHLTQYASPILSGATVKGFMLLGELPNPGDSFNVQLWANGAMLFDSGTIDSTTNDGNGNAQIITTGLSISIPAQSPVAFRWDQTNEPFQWVGGIHLEITIP